MEILRTEGLVKLYGERRAVNGACLAVEEGAWVQVLGGAGAGKTTLAKLILGIEKPDDGRILLAGQALGEMPESRARALLREYVGPVPRGSGLWQEYTVWENVALPMTFGGMSREQAKKRALDLLSLLGIRQIAGARPESLTDCDGQAAALARAAALSPKLLLLDEYASGVSRREEHRLWGQLRTLSGQWGAAVLSLASEAAEGQPFQKRYRLKNGSLTEETEE